MSKRQRRFIKFKTELKEKFNKKVEEIKSLPDEIQATERSTKLLEERYDLKSDDVAQKNKIRQGLQQTFDQLKEGANKKMDLSTFVDDVISKIEVTLQN
ncbi:19848_t:CDS:2 [Funneliformis geosporum]|nr:19848_t:CDS:2 [Funneliformis geosporum]